MSDLINFWKIIDNNNKNKKTQLQYYIDNNATDEILKFIKLGGGPSLGSIAEQYSKFKFNILKDRNETNHDHIIIINNKIIKIEQKTSTLNKNNDFLWQHIAEKHPWNILLFVGIHFTDVKFYAINKNTFIKLVNDKKITNQGSKNKDSEQGMWCKFSNIKNDIFIINTNEDLINLCNDL